MHIQILLKDYGFTIKRSCPRHNRAKQHFLGYLATFIIQRKWKDDPDSFGQFMRTAATLYCGKTESDILDPSDFVEDE